VRILLCDHHRLLVEVLAAALRRIGHDVVAMTTLPEEAVDAAVEHDPDVCLLDVVFPGGRGIDTVARIRATTRAKVLVLSTQCDDDAVCAALAAGAGGFVGKSQGIDDVVRSLDQVCAGRVIVPVENAPARGPARPRPPEVMALRFLTGREREALRLIAEGESTKEIAQSMHVAYSTARTHVQNVLTKLGVRSRLQAAALVAGAGVTEQLDDRIVGGRSGGSDSDNYRSRAPSKGGGTRARPTSHWHV
jgi:two-component system, NarL family, nitrate/nitrite response regulator NarL